MIPAALKWGPGDLYTLFIAIPFFVFGCFLHWRTIMARGHDASEVIVGIMASSLSVGPLIMILVDPFNQSHALINIDLFQTVIEQARLTLWFASFLAFTNTLLGMLRPKEGSTWPQNH